jgi:hypothetical protein
MEMRSEQQQRQNAGNRLFHSEVQLPEKSEADQSRKHRNEHIGAIADDDAAHAGIVPVVVSEDRKPLDISSHYIRGQHEQRLADAVIALQLAVAAVYAKFGILLGRDRGFRSPERVSGLQTMPRVRRAQFAGLHGEGDQARCQSKQEERIAEPVA